MRLVSQITDGAPVAAVLVGEEIIPAGEQQVPRRHRTPHRMNGLNTAWAC